MPQIGSEKNSVVLRSGQRNKGRTLGVTGSFYKTENKSKYDSNWDRIFGKKHQTEFDIAREKSKTFSMEQD